MPQDIPKKYAELSKNLPMTSETDLLLAPTAPKLPNYLENIIKQLVAKFKELRNIDVKQTFENASQINRSDLIHGVRNVDFEDLLKILDTGVVSGEIGFDGKDKMTSEDGETHYHADFFMNTDQDKNLTDYLQWASESENPESRITRKRMEYSFMPTKRNDTAVLIFDAKNPELESFLQFSTNGAMAKKFDSIFKDLGAKFPLDTERHVAVPVGLPSNFCKSIVVGSKITQEQVLQLGQKINELNLSIFIFDIDGKCLFQPDNKSEAS
jgi:hypothetical protein